MSNKVTFNLWIKKRFKKMAKVRTAEKEFDCPSRYVEDLIQQDYNHKRDT